MALALILLCFVAGAVLCLLPYRAWLPGAHLGLAALAAVAGSLLIAELDRGTLPRRWGAVALRLDALSAFMVATILLIALLALWHSRGYVARELARGGLEPHQAGRYYLYLDAFILMMLIAVVVDNVGLMWVALEATTLATVLLIGLHHTKEAIEASWKYLLIGSVGIALAFIGTVLVYCDVSILEPAREGALDGSRLLEQAASFHPAFLRLAFVFLFLGYGTKAGLAPMHTWLPDAHSEAPAPVSALMSGVLLSVSLYALLRFKPVVDLAAGADFSARFMIGFGLLSLGIAAGMLVIQRNYKRMLAYSSVEHMGVVCLGLGFGGSLGTVAALLHILFHALGKSALFLLAGNIQQTCDSTQINQATGLLRRLPVSGRLFGVGTLALLGAPPFGIFFTELAILRAGFQAGYLALTLAAAALLAVIFAAMLAHLQRLLFGEVERAAAAELTVAPAAFALGLLLLLGVWLPPPLARLVERIGMELMP